jgi:hypothetical protein
MLKYYHIYAMLWLIISAHWIGLLVPSLARREFCGWRLEFSGPFPLFDDEFIEWMVAPELGFGKPPGTPVVLVK